MLEYESRNIAILDDRLSGKTYRQIAQKHEITVERARQIVVRFRNRAIRSDEYAAKLSDALLDVASLRHENKKLLGIASRGKAALVDDLEFSIRTSNCLKSAGIDIVADLMMMDDESLLSIPNLGRKSLKEIREVLRNLPY